MNYDKMIKNRFKNTASVEAKFKEYSDTFSVDLIDIRNRKPDCCIGHFGYNFYFRTPYGIQYKKYKSFKTLFNAIKIVAKRNGLSLESLGLKRGWRYKAILTG